MPSTRCGERASRPAPAWLVRPCGWPRPPRSLWTAPPPILERLACARRPCRPGCRRWGKRVLVRHCRRGGGKGGVRGTEANTARRSRRGWRDDGAVGWEWWSPWQWPAPRFDVGRPLNWLSAAPPLCQPGLDRLQQEHTPGAPARPRGGGAAGRAPIQGPLAVARAGDRPCRHLHVPCEKSLAENRERVRKVRHARAGWAGQHGVQ